MVNNISLQPLNQPVALEIAIIHLSQKVAKFSNVVAKLHRLLQRFHAKVDFRWRVSEEDTIADKTTCFAVSF